MWVVLWLLLGTFMACSSDDSGAGDASLTFCRKDADCQGGERCVWDACRTHCEGDADCSDGLVCHGEKICAECRTDDGCPGTERCLDGACAPTAGGGGGLCENSDACGAGEGCVGGLCRPLCQRDEECPASLPDCGERHYCTGCEADDDCGEAAVCDAGECRADASADGDGPSDGDALACGEDCDPDLGLFCNTATGRCEQIVCRRCDSDDDCRAPGVCTPDPAAGGNGICLVEQSECPAGYARGADDLCHPVARCLEGIFAGEGQACGFPGDDGPPPCAAGLRCLYNSSLSFCAAPCEAGADCGAAYGEGGCCADVEGERYCVTITFAALCGD